MGAMAGWFMAGVARLPGVATLQNAERKLGENWRWQGAYCGKNGVRGRNRMNTAETTVRLCGILHGLRDRR